MKDVFLTIIAGLVSINLIYAVTELKNVTNKLKQIEMVEMMQQPDHEDDELVITFENGFSDEELTEILGL